MRVQVVDHLPYLWSGRGEGGGVERCRSSAGHVRDRGTYLTPYWSVGKGRRNKTLMTRYVLT